MNKNMEQKALKQLVKIKGGTADIALNKRAEKILSLLEVENNYEVIEEQFKLLDIIAFRISEKAVEIIAKFLKRIRNISLTYQSIPSKFKEFYSKDTLVIEALEVLERIRYHQIELVLGIFLDYSISKNDKIRKQAERSLELLASYNISVIYGNKNWKGLGLYSQQKIIEKLEVLSKRDQQKYSSSVIKIISKILSSETQDSLWTYNTVTIRHSSVPINEELRDLRHRALEILKKLFNSKLSLNQKRQIIGAFNEASKTPNLGNYTDELLTLIQRDCRYILDFYISIIPREQYEILQSMEEDTAFIYQRAKEIMQNQSWSEEVKAESKLLINICNQFYEKLNRNEEYVIYKTLVGFESIFPQSWEDRDWKIENEEQYRLDKIQEYINDIEEINFDIWKNRILLCMQTESNDLATFRYFGRFLNELAKAKPKFIFELIENHEDVISTFLTTLLDGLLESNEQKRIYSLIEEWIDKGKYLRQSARVFEFNHNFDLNLLSQILNKAIYLKDNLTLIQVIASSAANYREGSESLIQKIFITSIQKLTDFKDTRWINGVWFRKELPIILSNLNEQDINIILENLLFCDAIDFHAEEVLMPIAKRIPEKVIEFFGARIKFEIERKKTITGRYDAVPFEFYKLKEPLSVIPEQAVDMISSWYNGTYDRFIYQCANLLRIIFPDFPKSFERRLLTLIQTGEERNIELVVAILRNYKGETFLHEACQALIKALPDGSKLLSGVRIILQNTGVVTGEYGYVQAYEHKIQEMKTWLQDSNDKIRKFAESYIADLEKMISFERSRAKEDIELRKHLYGTDGEDV